MSEVPFLRARIRHTVGSLKIDAEFALTRPWTVLFGASGTGKSTLLRVLAGLERAEFSDITRPAARDRSPRFGFVMQEAALFPHLTVEQNVAFGLRTMDQAARRARLEAMLTLFGLEPLRRRWPLRLSGGEQQRVAMARALAPGPALLLLDEPFGALDGLLKESLLETLSQALAAEGAAALYVSHDVAEAFQLGAEVLLLEAGKVVAQGPAPQVLAAHRARLLRQLGAD